MKKKMWALGILFILLITIVPFPTSPEGPPGWSDDTRITAVDDFSSLKARIVTDSQNDLHVVYNDYRHGPPELYYTKLDSLGNILVNEKVITDLDSAHSDVGDIAIDSNDNIHIIFSDVRGTGPFPNLEIYYEKLDNMGNTLVDELRITNALDNSLDPSIAVDSLDNLHIAWADERNFGGFTQEEIYYKYLDNNGSTLLDDIPVTISDGEESLFPDIQVDSQNNAHIVWLDDRNETGTNQNQDVFYSKMDPTGVILVENTRLFPRGDHNKPSIIVDSNDKVHLICGGLQNRKGNEFKQLYYMKLDNEGTPVSEELRLTNDNGNATYPVIDITEGNEIHIVWEDERHYNNTEIYYMRVDDNGNILDNELRLTDNLSHSVTPQVVLDENENIKVVWTDGRDYMDGNKVELYHKQTIKTPANMPPNLSITSPSSGEEVSDEITIQGWASDFDGTIQRVDVKIDSSAWKAAQGTDSWNYKWNTTSASQGLHKIQARSFDGTDYSDVHLINVTVNNTIPDTPPNEPPSLQITTPSGTEVSGAFSIQGSASDSDGSVQKILIKIDQGGWNTAGGTHSWSYLWDTTSVSNGEHVISAKSEDNDGAQSSTDSITLLVNNTGNFQPFLEINSPAAQTVFGVVEIAGSASDMDGDETISSVTVRIDDIWETAQGTATWTYTWDTTDLDDGEYMISARAYDGFLFSEIRSITITVDNPHPPTLSVFSDIPNKVSGTLSLHGTSSDEDGDIEFIEIQIDSKDWEIISNSEDWSYELDSKELSNGVHTIRLRVTDDEGEQDLKTLTFNVENTEEDYVCLSIVSLILLIIILIVLVAVKRRAKRRRYEAVAASSQIQQLKCPSCRTAFKANVNEQLIQCPNCGYGAH